MAMVESTTPNHQTSPQKQDFTITEAQKQALIDNLQLEVTERARKLRAQYALQAQGLRSRLEMRINRIPTSLRKTKMQTLVDNYAQQHKPAPSSSLPQKLHVANMASPPKPRGVKRPSDDYQVASDKENSHPNNPPLDSPKKRTKPNPPSNITTMQSAIPSSPATTRSTRGPALKSPIQHANPITILSPRSQNSRTFNQSPVRSPPPFKFPATTLPTSTNPYSRPGTAPSKLTASPAKVPRPVSRTTKRPATRQEDAQPTHNTRTSTGSDDSTHTTIVYSHRKHVANSSVSTMPKPTKSRPTMTTIPTFSAPAPVSALASAPAPAPPQTKRAGLKNALSSLTGSKKGKNAAAAAAAAAAAKENAIANAPAPAEKRVLRKRN